MDANEYQRACLRTERPQQLRISIDTARVLHGAIGLGTEAGELLDNVKRALFYGREVDKVNVLEECGDALWYIAVALEACGYTITQAMAANVAKLKARYPEGFSEVRAVQRTLDVERTVLESRRCANNPNFECSDQCPHSAEGCVLP